MKRLATNNERKIRSESPRSRSVERSLSCSQNLGRSPGMDQRTPSPLASRRHSTFLARSNDIDDNDCDNGRSPERSPLHVPYMDSKLTALLRDSLGGGSRAVFIASLNLQPSYFKQNLNTLEVISRASKVTNKPNANHFNVIIAPSDNATDNSVTPNTDEDQYEILQNYNFIYNPVINFLLVHTFRRKKSSPMRSQRPKNIITMKKFFSDEPKKSGLIRSPTNANTSPRRSSRKGIVDDLLLEESRMKELIREDRMARIREKTALMESERRSSLKEKKLSRSPSSPRHSSPVPPRESMRSSNQSVVSPSFGRSPSRSPSPRNSDRFVSPTSTRTRYNSNNNQFQTPRSSNGGSPRSRGFDQPSNEMNRRKSFCASDQQAEYQTERDFMTQTNNFQSVSYDDQTDVHDTACSSLRDPDDFRSSFATQQEISAFDFLPARIINGEKEKERDSITDYPQGDSSVWNDISSTHNSNLSLKNSFDDVIDFERRKSAIISADGQDNDLDSLNSSAASIGDFVSVGTCKDDDPYADTENIAANIVTKVHSSLPGDFKYDSQLGIARPRKGSYDAAAVAGGGSTALISKDSLRHVVLGTSEACNNSAAGISVHLGMTEKRAEVSLEFLRKKVEVLRSTFTHINDKALEAKKGSKIVADSICCTLPGKEASSKDDSSVFQKESPKDRSTYLSPECVTDTKYLNEDDGEETLTYFEGYRSASDDMSFTGSGSGSVHVTTSKISPPRPISTYFTTRPIKLSRDDGDIRIKALLKSRSQSGIQRQHQYQQRPAISASTEEREQLEKEALAARSQSDSIAIKCHEVQQIGQEVEAKLKLLAPKPVSENEETVVRSQEIYNLEYELRIALEKECECLNDMIELGKKEAEAYLTLQSSSARSITKIVTRSLQQLHETLDRLRKEKKTIRQKVDERYLALLEAKDRLIQEKNGVFNADYSPNCFDENGSSYFDYSSSIRGGREKGGGDMQKLLEPLRALMREGRDSDYTAMLAEKRRMEMDAQLMFTRIHREKEEIDADAQEIAKVEEERLAASASLQNDSIEEAR